MASSKLDKTTRSPDRCQPSEITGFPPDFNSAGSFDSILIRFIHSRRKNLILETRPKTLFRADRKNKLAENTAQADAEDSSKIKDRLEALLFAETLQGTLSPNANPGKGSVGGFTEFDAKSHREDAPGS